MNAGVRIVLRDERINLEHVYDYEGGLSEFVKYINEGKNHLNEIFHFTADADNGITVEVVCNGTIVTKKMFAVSQTTFHKRWWYALSRFSRSFNTWLKPVS